MKPSKSLFVICCLIFSVAHMQPAYAEGEKVKAGDQFSPLNLVNIHGAEVAIPDKNNKWVHLQFRRFAGCPICNLHLQTFIKRNEEIVAAGIKEVVVFHSPDSSLLDYQGKFPFDVIGDPEKILYKQFGVESSIWAVLNPKAWPAMIKGIMAKDKPVGDPEGGPFSLPADIMIAPNGKVVASHYGKHAYDQWEVDQVLAMVKK